MRPFSQFRIQWIALLGSIACLFPSAVTHAQPINFLIKGSSPTVYYNADDGKRYFFPNESVFKSWFPDFSSVAQISDEQLAAHPLGGNVTYRPGSVLVKITTDPKVYAVSRYGTLHWVTSETLAQALYGANWNTKVVDVPDTYFSNYLIGAPIASERDYSPTNEMASALEVQDNIRPANMNTPLPLNSSESSTSIDYAIVSVSLSTPRAVLNQMVTVNASVTGNNQPISKIEILSNTSVTPLKTCFDTTECGYSFTVITAPQTINFTAVAYDTVGNRMPASSGSVQTLTVIAASDHIQLSVTPLSATVGSRVSFSSSMNNSMAIDRHRILAIIPGQDQPVLWKDCGTATLCASSSPFYRTTYLYSEITNGNQVLVSPATLVTITGGDAPKPVLTVTGHPALGQIQIDLKAPSGEMVGMTSIVDGPTIDSAPLALCEATCTVVIQINKPSDITAFTWVGGKYEASNSVPVTP